MSDDDPRSDVARKLNEFPYFTAKPIREVENGAAWDSYVIGVFQHDAHGGETMIGEYERNYTFFRTFWWFRRGSRHFALYSPDYTATRLMEIFPGVGFKDLGGEDPATGGFCPVEFYVPDCREYVSQEFSGPGELINDWNDPLPSTPPGCEFTKEQGTHRGRAKLRGADGNYVQTDVGSMWGEEQDYESAWVRFSPAHGFVAGCVWGDDSSMKIQYVDLSRVDEGAIRREERFGYIELPESVLLRHAIRIHDLRETPRVDIAISTRWNLRTGQMERVGVPRWTEE